MCKLKHHTYSPIGLDESLSSDSSSALVVCKHLVWPVITFVSMVQLSVNIWTHKAI